MVPVGAAFDFHAGVMFASLAVQKLGPEAYRLVTEPRRLWKRYPLGNPVRAGVLTDRWRR